MASEVAAIVLAAGRSTRMGATNKLLADIDGVPMVRRVVDAALASRADNVLVVTGHEAARVEAALAGLDVLFVHNPDHADGLSTSVRAGVTAVPAKAAGAIVLLGDMPEIDTAAIDALVAAFRDADGRCIVAATAAGKRGNPVVWPASLFDALRAATGDTGGRPVLMRHADAIRHVEIGAAARYDIDTPADLTRGGSRSPN